MCIERRTDRFNVRSMWRCPYQISTVFAARMHTFFSTHRQRVSLGCAADLASRTSTVLALLRLLEIRVHSTALIGIIWQSGLACFLLQDVMKVSALTAVTHSSWVESRWNPSKGRKSFLWHFLECERCVPTCSRRGRKQPGKRPANVKRVVCLVSHHYIRDQTTLSLVVMSHVCATIAALWSRKNKSSHRGECTYVRKCWKKV